MSARHVAICYVAAFVLTAAGCSDAGSTADSREFGEPPCLELTVQAIPAGASVVLIVNDTMRRDRVGAYGGPAGTPAFDRFAEENVLFQHAVAPSPWTKPSIASLFTSLYPSQHRVASDPRLRDGETASESEPVDQATDVLSEEFITLAERLRDAGMRTAAFVSNPWLQARHGFAQGFDHYDDSFADWNLSGAAVSEAAAEWLAGVAPGERFFLYVHYIDSHRPYAPVEPEALAALPPREPDELPLLAKEARDLAQRVLKRTDGTPLVHRDEPVRRAAIELAYDRGLETFDDALATLLDALRRSDAWNRTAVVVTSDHGEALFERGYGNHGLGLFDDEAAIPLAARFPGTTPASAVVTCPVSLVDVLPSLCVYLGLAPPKDAVGWSFLASVTHEPPTARRFLVTEGTMTSPAHRAIQNQTYKLLYEPTGRRIPSARRSPYSLYDLVSDPGEHIDLLDTAIRTEEIKRVVKRLKRELGDAVPAYSAPEKTFAPADSEVVERLKDLGYLGD